MASNDDSKKKVGLLVVGIGGANGTTMVAGILANRKKMSWRGPRGEVLTANYGGCITQLEVGKGFKHRYPGLANVDNAAIGGWVSCCFFRLSEKKSFFINTG